MDNIFIAWIISIIVWAIFTACSVVAINSDNFGLADKLMVGMGLSLGLMWGFAIAGWIS